jgi:hypothetical protein
MRFFWQPSRIWDSLVLRAGSAAARSGMALSVHVAEERQGKQGSSGGNEAIPVALRLLSRPATAALLNLDVALQLVFYNLGCNACPNEA